MAERKYTYDSACEDLAAHFLTGERVSELALWSLAQTIQDAVEGWLYDRGLPPSALERGRGE